MAVSVGQLGNCYGCQTRLHRSPNFAKPFGARPPSRAFIRTRAAGERGPFNEGAAQVKKLLTRDKRELMGVEQIGQRARTEFDEESTSEQKPSTSGSDDVSNSGASTRRFGEGRSQQKSPFGSSGNTGAKRNANPFGPEKGTRTFNEPADLSPTMKPIPIDDTPWYKKITLSQVVIVISFTLIISSMLATFAFVLNVGAVRFND